MTRYKIILNPTAGRGTAEEVKECTLELLNAINDHSRVIYSCGGGMPPEVSNENIHAFIHTVQSFTP